MLIFKPPEMAVRHMQGEYSPCLYSLNWICRKLALSFDFFISDVRREQNTELAECAEKSGVQKFSSVMSHKFVA